MSSAPDVQTRRFTVDDVLRMAQAGRDRLVDAYRALGHVREEKPLQVSDVGLPEPDLAVLRGDARDCARAHPHGKDVLLVIETAVTSRAIDRVKAQEYALGGVPARRVEVHTEPQADGRYRVLRVLARDDAVELPGTDQRWSVSTLFA